MAIRMKTPITRYNPQIPIIVVILEITPSEKKRLHSAPM